MAITLKKQQTKLNPEDIASVLSSLRYTPPSSRGEHGTISVLGSPPVFLSSLDIFGHHTSSSLGGVISIKVLAKSDFDILSRFFKEEIRFKNWYPQHQRPSDRQRHWELFHGCIKIICIRRWGEGV